MEYKKAFFLILILTLCLDGYSQTKKTEKDATQTKASSEKNKELLRLSLEKNGTPKTTAADKIPVQTKTTTEKNAAQTKLDTLKNLTVKSEPAVVDTLTNLSLKFKPYKKAVHASYYHDKFNGQRTASGTRFSNKNYTAAHRKFPFGTKLRITNDKNGKSVIVEVQDRGPFSRGREIDLTKKAFMEIADNQNSGSMTVTIEEEKK